LGEQHNLENNNTRKEYGLAIITIVLAGASVNFFILGSLGVVQFTIYRNVLLIPSIIAIAGIAVFAHFRIKSLSNKLLTGLWAGAIATLALEAIRIPAYAVLHWLPGDDMIMMPGAFLTGLAPSPMALMQMMQSGMMANMPQSMMMAVMAAGALYHFWNGATLGVAYAVFAGKVKWYYGLVWGFIIHMGMMLAPWLIMMFGPFGLKYDGGYSIFTASLLAHLAYGAVLGVLVSRFVKDRNGIVRKVVRTAA
jgi:hypothetical protein